MITRVPSDNVAVIVIGNVDNRPAFEPHPPDISFIRPKKARFRVELMPQFTGTL